MSSNIYDAWEHNECKYYAYVTRAGFGIYTLEICRQDPDELPEDSPMPNLQTTLLVEEVPYAEIIVQLQEYREKQEDSLQTG